MEQDSQTNSRDNIVRQEIGFYVPRAIFYMEKKTPLRSLAEIFFSIGWKSSDRNLIEFEKELEKKFNISAPILTSHARIALYHVLKYLNFPESSEIIMSPISLAEMLKMVRLNKMNINYIGFKKNSFNLDFSKVNVTERTKAFLYTPIAGIHSDMDEITQFCRRNNLTLIMDLTQSLGGKWREAALHSLGDFSFYSFCDLKTLHTHRGAMIASRIPEFKTYIEKNYFSWFLPASTMYFLKFIFEDLFSVIMLNRKFFNYIGVYFLKALNRVDPLIAENITAGYGFKIKNNHFFKQVMASGNDWQSDEIPAEQKYRFTCLQARIGRERLKKFDFIESERKRKILLFYKNLRPKTKVIQPEFVVDSGHTFWRAPLIVEDFLDFQAYMLSKKIDVARSNLPWLPGLSLDTQAPSGEEMKTNCVYIPIYHYLSDQEVLQIAQVVNLYET